MEQKTIIIQDNEHFEFWQKEIKNDANVILDMIEYLSSTLACLREKEINCKDIIGLIALKTKIAKLETLVDRVESFESSYGELQVDLNEYVYVE